jgi:hypothetical protein
MVLKELTLLLSSGKWKIVPQTIGQVQHICGVINAKVMKCLGPEKSVYCLPLYVIGAYNKFQDFYYDLASVLGPLLLYITTLLLYKFFTSPHKLCASNCMQSSVAVCRNMVLDLLVMFGLLASH